MPFRSARTSWRDPVRAHDQLGRGEEHPRSGAVGPARRIVVIPAGQLDRRPEDEGAGADADRLERVLLDAAAGELDVGRSERAAERERCGYPLRIALRAVADAQRRRRPCGLRREGRNRPEGTAKRRHARGPWPLPWRRSSFGRRSSVWYGARLRRRRRDKAGAAGAGSRRARRISAPRTSAARPVAWCLGGVDFGRPGWGRVAGGVRAPGVVRMAPGTAGAGAPGRRKRGGSRRSPSTSGRSRLGRVGVGVVVCAAAPSATHPASRAPSATAMRAGRRRGNLATSSTTASHARRLSERPFGRKPS